MTVRARGSRCSPISTSGGSSTFGPLTTRVARARGVRRWRRELRSSHPRRLTPRAPEARCRRRADLPRATGRRRAGGPARPPPRPRLRRARPARAGGRPRPASGGCTSSRRARRCSCRARPAITGTSCRASAIPTPTTFHAAYAKLAGLHDELWERTGIGPERTVLGGFSMGSVMSYALGLGPGPPRAGGDPRVLGLRPDRRGLGARPRGPHRHARLHRARPPRPGHAGRLRPRAPATCSRAAASTSTTTSPTPATTSIRRTCRRRSTGSARRSRSTGPTRDDRGLAGAAVRGLAADEGDAAPLRADRREGPDGARAVPRTTGGT